MRIPNFTKADYLETTKPYEFAYQFHKDPFEHEQIITQICEQARAQGIANFGLLYHSYVRTLKIASQTRGAKEKPEEKTDSFDKRIAVIITIR